MGFKPLVSITVSLVALVGCSHTKASTIAAVPTAPTVIEQPARDDLACQLYREGVTSDEDLLDFMEAVTHSSNEQLRAAARNVAVSLVNNDRFLRITATREVGKLCR